MHTTLGRGNRAMDVTGHPLLNRKLNVPKQPKKYFGHSRGAKASSVQSTKSQCSSRRSKAVSNFDADVHMKAEGKRGKSDCVSVLFQPTLPSLMTTQAADARKLESELQYKNTYYTKLIKISIFFVCLLLGVFSISEFSDPLEALFTRRNSRSIPATRLSNGI